MKEDTAINGSAASASRAIGAMFFIVSGGVWLVVGVFKGHGLSLVPLLTIVAVTLLLFFIALRKFRANRGAHAAEANSPENKRAGRIFNAVNAIQWSLVFV